jgi:Flp pilus assembly protein TadG
VKGRSREGRGTLGAVYVEFIIAFMPFFIFFLCLWQVSILYSAKLIVDYAADSAARAAATILGDDPANYDHDLVNTVTSNRIAMITTAAELAAAPLIVDKTIVTLNVSFPDFALNSAIPAMNSHVRLTQHMKVQVTAEMNCKISFANLILCKAKGVQDAPLSLTIVSGGDFPYMGASYGY